jgi:NAD(P)-dependent dehydrogenase (short-subunit alcohol dehydrogenase family)
MNAAAIDTTRADGADWTQRHQKDASEIPLGRIGTSEEIAAVCAFLGSTEASFK